MNLKKDRSHLKSETVKDLNGSCCVAVHFVHIKALLLLLHGLFYVTVFQLKLPWLSAERQ